MILKIFRCRTTVYVGLVSLAGVLAGCQILSMQSDLRAAREFHVSPSGDARNPGTKAEPFATLQQARDAVRALKQTGPLKAPVTVFLHGGTYFLNEPLVLTAADSGTAEYPVTYSAARGARPVISGGVRIQGWRKHAGNLWMAEVPWVTDRAETFTQLFVNGGRRVRARTPNCGSYLYSKRLSLSEGQPGTCTGLTFFEGDLGPWIAQKDARIVLFHNWVNSYNAIQTVDWSKRRITFERPAGIFFLGPEVRYYAENAFALLDEAGEWYAEQERGRLFYAPKADEDMSRAEVIAPVLASSLVNVAGDPAKGAYVENLVFRGLSFQHTDADLSQDYPHSVQGAHTQRGAFFATGLRASRIEACEFTRLGEHAVSLREGCSSNIIRQCHMLDLGGGGVYLSEGSPSITNDWALTAHNTVDNNFIHDGGRVYRAACGIFLGGSASYNRITHNEICDLSWMGVHLGWSWTGRAPAYTHHNEVGHNHIHNLGNGVLNDIGGIYTLGVSPGTVLHHNRIHDISRFERGREGYGGWGIYLDAGSSEIRVENNVVYDTRDGGLHLHCYAYPFGNVVTNNVFAFSHDAELVRNATMEHEKRHATLERNIVYGPSRHMAGGGNWKTGSNFSADLNCYWSTTTPAPEFGGRTFAAWQAEGQDQHGLLADPGFVDAARRDFRLRPDSPARSLGFEPIDISRAGLYGAKSWTRLPKTVVHRSVETAAAPARPTTFADSFEEYAVGEHPDHARVSEANKDAVIRVTDDCASTGKQCLKAIDGPGQKYAHDPHLYYDRDFPEGRLAGSFDLRLQPGAILSYEWRDWPNGETLRAGPNVRINADGTLVAGGKKLLTLPHGQWVNIEAACNSGAGADALWQLTVRLPGQDPQRFADLPCSASFKKLNWLGFISLATNTAVFYLDNVRLERMP